MVSLLLTIALIHGTEPVAGVVYVPVNRKLYYGDTRSCSSFLEFEGEKGSLLEICPRSTNNNSGEQAPWQKKLEAFLKTADELFPNVNVINMGAPLSYVCLQRAGPIFILA